jgi:hypothetical protein
MDFLEHYLFTEASENGDWRSSRRVWHTTPTGRRTHVLIKSLPPSEQWRYAPVSVRLKHNEKLAPTKTSTPMVPEKQNRLFTLYYSAKRQDGFDKFSENKLTVATDDSSKAIEIEEQGHKIAAAHNVPISAFKKYWDYETKSWKDFPKDLDDERKFELIKFTDNDVYLVDFFSNKDKIEFVMSSKEEDEEPENKEDYWDDEE